MALVLLALLAVQHTALAWWGDSDITPTAFGGSWATTGDCGNQWYVYSHFTTCAARGFNATFNCGFNWNGRGYIHMDYVNGGSKADTIDTLRIRNSGGGLTGQTIGWNTCTHTCSWQSVLDGETADQYQYNGMYINADESTGSTCGSICGSAPTDIREIHMYGDKWVYLNDWIVFGGYANAVGVSTVGWTPPFAESGVYVYGAIDTSHGNYFANNLYGGKTPYRVQTGDCGANTSAGSGSYPNYLNFKGNAGANGNNNCDNCDGYAFAWVYTPGGAGPQWGVGSDDGDRIWLNGTLIADNNVARGQTWDGDRFLPTGMGAGWNRVLFKVHNGGGGFSGVISLHNGSDFHQMEPSISLQSDRYGGFSVGYEQDAWFPTITVSDFYGVSSPTVGAAYYGNNTSVTVNSGSSATGSGSPVPYWRTMQYQWGYNLGGADSNYADVSGTPTGTSWSHTTTGVTAHRRFHFFAVSKSGRTSGQASGSSGAWTYDSGHAKYYDVWVDNVAPNNPSFSSVTAASTTQINLAWAIPLDKGVGVADGSTEAAGNISNNQDANNYYRRGDVGVQVYRNGSVITNWSTSTAMNDAGLSANTQYTYTLQARDNTSGSRGAWSNATAIAGSTAKYTLSVAPTAGSVTSDQSNPGTVNWTAVGGFGAGTLHHYAYAFDQSATHTFTGSEPTWSNGILATVPSSGGTWYLHVKGFNGDSVANGAFDYAVTTPTAPAITSQPAAQTVCAGSTATFTVAASGTSPSYAWYRHSNAGWGSVWTVGANSGGTFLGTSAQNNSGDANCNTFSSFADINTPSGTSLGLFGGSSGESVSRNFPAALTNGQIFRIDMDNGNVDSGKQNGFSLQTAGGTFLFSFYFLGGTANYQYTDSTGNHDTGIGFTRRGLRVQVVVGTGNTYSLLVTPCVAGTSAFSGAFAASGNPGKVVLFNNNVSGGDANNLYFNSIFAGLAYDTADNYSGNWAGADKGDKPIDGATGTSYSTSSGSNGDLYYAFAYNSAGVAVSSSAALTVNPRPAAVASGSATICNGSSTTISAALTGTGPWNVSWSDGVNSNGVASSPATRSISPSTTTTYTVTNLTDAKCTAQAGDLTGSAVVTVNPLPAVSVNSATNCAGASATLTATTDASSPSYLWSPGGVTTASITVSPSSTTTYTVTVTDGVTGCANSGSGTVTVNPLPTVSVNSATNCAGGSATLTATTDASGPSYLWSPGGATTASITVSPASTTTYTVTVTDGVTGCANSGSGTVTVNPLPTVSVNSATINAGGSATLTATTSASNPSYLWSPGGATTASITVSPASTTTYTATVTDGVTGCANSGSGTVTVNPQPTLTTDTTNQTACAGSEVTWSVAATGTGLGYHWQRDGTNLLEGVDNFTGTSTATLTNSAVAAPDGGDAAHGYACVVTNDSGSVTSTLVSLTVNPLPAVSVNSATNCAGGSATLTATTDASSPSYLWSPGGATTASITVSPASTTTYTVTVTDGTTSCANSGSGTVTVNPLPAVSVNSATNCAGGSATLTATTDASSPSYLWSPGGATTASITVSPSSTTTYTVTVTDGTTSCANTGSGTVTVNPLPAVSVNSATNCAGGSATLTATTDASSPSYLWSPGGATTASIMVSPYSTTTYTVAVTDGTTSCANSGSGTVTVNPQPALTTDTTNQTACAGSAVTWQVEATGTGLSYQWQRDGTNLLEGVDNFTGATTAALTNSAVGAQDSVDAAHGYACVISSGTCSVTSTLVSLTVNPLATVNVNSATNCAGGSATLTATTDASSPSYLWSPGGATTASITVSPSSTTTYTVTVTDGTSGCANSGSGTVTVNPLPTVSVNSATNCAGGSTTLTATTDASSPSYLWSPGGATTASITVSPSSTTTYAVTVTDGVTGCANSGSGTVTVNPAPIANAGPDKMVCADSPVEIGGSPTASGGTGPFTYAWAPSTGLSDATVSNPAAAITSTTTYTVTVTDANGCTNNDSVVLTVAPQPVVQSITMSGVDVTLVWSSVAGQTYRVQYKNDLNDAGWTDLTPDVTASGATAAKVDSVGAATQRFYRVSFVCP